MWKAWTINSIILGLISAFTIEIRRILDEHEFVSMLPDVPHKLCATIIISSLGGFIAYTLSRLIFGTGEGLIEPNKMNPMLF